MVTNSGERPKIGTKSDFKVLTPFKQYSSVLKSETFLSAFTFDQWYLNDLMSSHLSFQTFNFRRSITKAILKMILDYLVIVAYLVMSIYDSTLILKILKYEKFNKMGLLCVKLIK